MSKFHITNGSFFEKTSLCSFIIIIAITMTTASIYAQTNIQTDGDESTKKWCERIVPIQVPNAS